MWKIYVFVSRLGDLNLCARGKCRKHVGEKLLNSRDTPKETFGGVYRSCVKADISWTALKCICKFLGNKRWERKKKFPSRVDLILGKFYLIERPGKKPKRVKSTWQEWHPCNLLKSPNIGVGFCHHHGHTSKMFEKCQAFQWAWVKVIAGHNV